MYLLRFRYISSEGRTSLAVGGWRHLSQAGVSLHVIFENLSPRSRVLPVGLSETRIGLTIESKWRTVRVKGLVEYAACRQEMGESTVAQARRNKTGPFERFLLLP